MITLKTKFEKIKRLNWVESKRNGPTGIGYTFESLIGKKEDNICNPDYKNIEIKTKKYGSKSYTNLFSLAPKNETSTYEIKRLLNKFGYPDKILKNKKVLNVEMYANKKNLIANSYFFQLNINKTEEKIYLYVYNLNYTLNEGKAFWSFKEIEEKLNKKIKKLAYIHAFKRTINGKEYYKYYKLDFYLLKNFETFINLIEDGTIRIKFKIGVIRTGINKGKIHDRGTSFEIKEDNLEKLFHKISI